MRWSERKLRSALFAVARRSALNAFAWHASGPVAAVRDMILATPPGARLASNTEWLFGWDPDEALAATADR